VVEALMASTEDAWKIHEALVTWTSNVDTKASIVLAVDTALAGGVVTLAGDHHSLAHLHGFAAALFWVGVSLQALGLLSAAAVVTPQVRAKKTEQEWPHGFIFFGHVRHWREDQLSAALANDDILPMLTRQLIAMSAIAWRKHRYLQASMLLTLFGTAVIALAATLG
jgi:hypothetical protein